MEEKIKKEETQKNTPSIVGFILSFFLTIIPIILCIIGIKKSQMTGKGKTLSIVGIIIVIIKAILLIWLFNVMVNNAYAYLNSNEEMKAYYCAEAMEEENLCTDNEDGTYSCGKIVCDITTMKTTDEDEETNEEAIEQTTYNENMNKDCTSMKESSNIVASTVICSYEETTQIYSLIYKDETGKVYKYQNNTSLEDNTIDYENLINNLTGLDVRAKIGTTEYMLIGENE